MLPVLCGKVIGEENENLKLYQLSKKLLLFVFLKTSPVLIYFLEDVENLELNISCFLLQLFKQIATKSLLAICILICIVFTYTGDLSVTKGLKLMA